MLKILVVDDMLWKRELLEEYLKPRNIEIHVEESVSDAYFYITKCASEIDGIILDLGLPIFYSDMGSYDTCNGIIFASDLLDEGIDIPILLNSETNTGISKEEFFDKYPNIFGQMWIANDYETLESFISFLD